MATRKRRAEIASAGSPPDDIDLTSASVPADPDEHICKIPDSQRLFISLTGKSFERALLSKLDWFSYLYVPKPQTLTYGCLHNAHRTSTPSPNPRFFHWPCSSLEHPPNPLPTPTACLLPSFLSLSLCENPPTNKLNPAASSPSP